MSKSINATISKKYNINRYGKAGHEIIDNNNSVFVSNSTSSDYLNWSLAVEFAKKYFKEKSKTKTMSTKKPTKRTTAKKLCSSVIVKDGLKKDGSLKKGYRYAEGGKIVKAKPIKKVAAKKKTTVKKKK